MPTPPEQLAKIRSETTGEDIVRIAMKALDDPLSCTAREIKKLAAFALPYGQQAAKWTHPKPVK